MGSRHRVGPVTVRSGDVSLAVVDWPHPDVDAPTIVLMHGLGATQRSMSKVAEHLPEWRVITMDLRGHGKSSSAPWDFPSAIADLDAVVAHFDLERPYIGGHSLGGMVALQYALAGRPVAGVVNIDGWGPGIASRYLGMDETMVEARLDQIATGDLSSRLAQAVAGLSRQSREGTTHQVLALLNRADVVAWHRAVTVDSLAFNALAPAGRVVVTLMGKKMARMQDSHRQGLRRDLATAAKERPNLTVVEVDATHSLITTHPKVVAAAINEFHRQRT